MDVPGFDEGPSYVYEAKSGDKYGYGFGLSYPKTKSIDIGEFLKNLLEN
jgi:beta-glucosidase